MLTSIEPEKTELKRSEATSKVWTNIHGHESNSPCQNMSDDVHHPLETKVLEVAKMDDMCRKEKIGVINYEIIEKLASDPCLTVRIAVKKEKPTVNLNERNKSPVDITENDRPTVGLFGKDKPPMSIIPAVNIPENGNVVKEDFSNESDEAANVKFVPGMWRPTKRRKKNLINGSRKKSWRLECMVPGCFTRAYSSKFVDFPNESERRQEWASQARLSEKFPSVNPNETLPKRIGLCVAHFREEDFNVITRGDGKICKLKDTATPSLFPWVDTPANVSTGMDIFNRTRFSRELRLLSLMKAELHHMMNPPHKVYEGFEENSEVPQHLPTDPEKHSVQAEASHHPQAATRGSCPHDDVLQHTAAATGVHCAGATKIPPHPPDVKGNIVVTNELSQSVSNDTEHTSVRNLPPRRCKMRLPEPGPVIVPSKAEIFKSSNITTSDQGSPEISCSNHARRSSRIRYPCNSVTSMYRETPQPKFKSSTGSKKSSHSSFRLGTHNSTKLGAHTPSRPVSHNSSRPVAQNSSRLSKPKMPLKSEHGRTNNSNGRTRYQQVEQRYQNKERFPRKCKFRMPYVFYQDIYGNSKSYSSSNCKSSSKNRDEKDSESRIIYHHENQTITQPENNIFLEDQLYDIKIENCEDDTVAVDCSIEESCANLSADGEQDVFDHFLAPYSNPADVQIPNQEASGSLSTEIITSCVEAAMSPMMIKLESFQGRVESRLEQLEEKLNSRLDSLEGRVSSCLDKLEHLSNNPHPKTSNVSPGVLFNKMDQLSENSIPLPPANGLTAPLQHMEVSLKPFAISEKEYEMMEGEDIIC